MTKSIVLVAAGVLLSGGAIGAYGATHNAGTVGQVSLGAETSTSTSTVSHSAWSHGALRGGMMGNLMADAAKSLNISTATLQADIKAGDSLAAIASNNGSSAAALEATLTKAVTAQIQSAVSAGKLTATQSSKIVANLSKRIDTLVTSKPGSLTHGYGNGENIMGSLMGDVSKVLNVSKATLRTDMKSGESLATIASDNGSSAATLESTLTTNVTTKLQNLVSTGKMTATQEATIEKNLSDVIDRFVTSTRVGMDHGRFRGKMGGGLMYGMMSDVSKALNMSVATLRTDMKSGESLATIANDNGSSAGALESTLATSATNKIQSLVSSGKMTATQAKTLETNLGKMVDAFVTQNGGSMTGGGFGMMGGWGSGNSTASTSTAP